MFNSKSIPSQVNEASLYELRLENRLVQKALKVGIEPLMPIVVAGGWPLSKYLVDAATCGTLPPGRKVFKATDIDCFCFGGAMEDEDDLERLVIKVMQNWRNSGLHCESVTRTFTKYDSYVAPAHRIINMKLHGIAPVFSFIQKHNANTAKEVVQGFDLNVVRVVYSVIEQKVVPESPAIEMSILKGEGHFTREAQTYMSFPTHNIQQDWLRNMERWQKYSRRGFKITVCPSIKHRIIWFHPCLDKCSFLYDASSSGSSWKYEHPMCYHHPISWKVHERHQTLERFRITIRMIKSMFPRQDLTDFVVAPIGNALLKPHLASLPNHKGVSHIKIVDDVVDLMVCGKHARTPHTFKNYITKCLGDFVRTWRNPVEVFFNNEHHLDYFKEKGYPCVVVKVQAPGHADLFVLKLILCHGYSSVLQYINCLGMSAQRMWFDFGKDQICMSTSDAKCTNNGVIKASNIYLQGECPSDTEMVLIARILRKMEFFSDAGFRFMELPSVHAGPVDHANPKGQS